MGNTVSIKLYPGQSEQFRPTCQDLADMSMSHSHNRQHGKHFSVVNSASNA